MAEISRTTTKKETLKLLDCPVCGEGGDLTVTDCGYSSFNPGEARCSVCRRIWRLGYVDDRWQAGEFWNSKCKQILEKLEILKYIKVDKSFSITRNFHREEQEEKAQRMLDKLKNDIIGGRV